MKIIATAAFSVLLHAAVTSASEGPTKKPARKGTILAGGHRGAPHSRRTTALTHSMSHYAAPRHPRRATATHSKAHHAEPRTALRASTRGGAAAGRSVKTKDPTSAPVAAPAPVFSPSSFSGFDIFSLTSGEELPCPPPQEILDQLGMTADDIDCDQDGGDWFIDDECAEMYNSTPPCPPSEVLTLLNLTLAELNCDSGVLPPCPYPELATALDLNVDALECDKEFWCFSHNYINENTTVQCPADDAIFELEMLYGIWCEHNDTNWIFPGEERNYTTIECPAPIPCSLPYASDADATGIVVCDASGAEFGFDTGFTMCINPTEAFEGDTCGCCGGTCPEPCAGSACKVPVYFFEDDGDTNGTEAPVVDGVWLQNVEAGYAQCVTPQDSTFMQMDGYFTCLDACSN